MFKFQVILMVRIYIYIYKFGDKYSKNICNDENNNNYNINK